MRVENDLRRQLFVEPRIQGALVRRVALYWVFCLLTIAALLLCWHIYVKPGRPLAFHLDQMWFFYGPAFVASFLVIPVVLIDIVRLSHRFSGPLIRLRQALRQLAEGDDVDPLLFRDSDFLQELVPEFNAVARRLRDSTPDFSSREGIDLELTDPELVAPAAFVPEPFESGDSAFAGTLVGASAD
ncbi:MAG: hypothetical protein HQ581_19280 [Planctomycetes bacterium]|nr:hypothetical protein [Planctomycetota bacterium]